MEHSHRLRRRLSWPLITLSGLGTTIGAGSYVRLRAVVSEAGRWRRSHFCLPRRSSDSAPYSFAELCSRSPASAGEAVYVQESFRLRWLSVLVGLLVSTVGIVSAVAIANGFVDYLNELAAVPRAPTLIVLAVALTAAILTLIEIGGLLLIIGGAIFHAPPQPLAMIDFLPSASGADRIAIVAGAFLAYYAFIGFEDMTNVAEEAREVEITMSDNRLTIEGEKTSEKNEENERYHLVERSYGSILRTIDLPSDVMADRIEAELDKGVLKISVPNSPQAVERVKKIAVKSKD